MKNNFNKSIDTINQKCNEEYFKLKNSINNECKSYLIQLIILIIFDSILISAGVYFLANENNKKLSFCCLIAIPFLSFLTLCLIRSMHRKKSKSFDKNYEKIYIKLQRNIRYKYLHPKIINKTRKSKNKNNNPIISVIKKITNNVTFVSIILIINLLIPKIFSNYTWVNIFSYLIQLFITAFLTTKIEDKKVESANILINFIFLVSFIALSLIFNISIGNTNNFENCINDTFDICNYIYFALGIIMTCFDSQNR